MFLGDAAGCEMFSRWAGTPATPGRALGFFFSAQTAEKRPRSLSRVICVPTLAPSHLARPWKALNCLASRWNGAAGAASPPWAQNGVDQSVVRLSCLHAHARLRDPSFPGPVFGRVLLGQRVSDTPERHRLADPHVGNDVQATPFLGWNLLAGSLGWKHPGEVAADKSCVSEPKDWRVEGGCSAFAAGCFSLCGTLQEKQLWEPPVKPRRCPCSLAVPGN